MDNFSLGATRHPQFRISPVNFPGTSRHSSNSNNNHFASHQDYIDFRTGILQLARAGNSANYLNSTAPPNHFNFPLMSNTMNGRSIGNFNNGNNGAGASGGGAYNKPRGNSSQAHNLNKNRSQPFQNTASGNNSNPNATSSKGQGQINENSNFSQPQYRIFKRGDSIPGISSPVTALNALDGKSEDLASSQVGNFNTESESIDIASGGFPNKENNTEKESSDTSQKKALTQPNKTPVSVVSDIARFHGLSVEYRLIGEKGPPHNPTFTVALHLGPKEEYVGQGSSIKRAQIQAAVEALEKTELSRPAPRSQAKRSFGQQGKRPNWAILQLSLLAEELKEPIQVVQQPMTIVDPFRRADPPSVVSIHVGERIFTGEGSNFNAAKNVAAVVGLKAMLKVKQEIEMKKHAESGSENADNAVNTENKSPISVVHEMAMKRGLEVKFEVVTEEGPPHNKIFTVSCSLGNGEHNAVGQGPTKQAAKKAASELMIEKLNQMAAPSSSLQVGSLSLKSIQRGLYRQKVPRKKTSAPVVKDLEKQCVSPISRLIQIAHIRKYKEPEFTLIGFTSNGPDDSVLKAMSERERRNIRKKKPTFTMEVTVGPHCCRGTGPNKRAAKKVAAELALIELGYGPTETTKEIGGVNTNSGAKDKSTGKPNVEGGNRTSGFKESGISSSSCTITSARQIVPGVLVVNTDTKDYGNGSPVRTPSVLAQEMIKVNSMSPPSSSSGVCVREGTEKLAYLARLLEVPVSYSDFPKKNEFLSVVSLGTNPPHVAHGCGATLEEAQNSAATKILEELSDMGLDNVKSIESESSAPTFGDRQS